MVLYRIELSPGLGCSYFLFIHRVQSGSRAFLMASLFVPCFILGQLLCFTARAFLFVFLYGGGVMWSFAFLGFGMISNGDKALFCGENFCWICAVGSECAVTTQKYHDRTPKVS